MTAGKPYNTKFEFFVLNFLLISRNVCLLRKDIHLVSLPDSKGPAGDIVGATAGVSVAEVTVGVTADVTAVNKAINRTRIYAIVIELLKMSATKILN